MSKELSERVCRKMGIEPETLYVRTLNLVVHQPVYPDLLTTEWAGRLLAMLAERGLAINTYYFPQFKRQTWIVAVGENILRTGDTLAEAVCLAIDAMPEGL